ncbi:glycosyltransferase family 4 protein [Polynucleobacter corsicus]|uniref:glycosyltransferase family 4 protein n=1 Tax=Polynucleobacter corsicus TaxID=2081042 RepID=UPI001BFEC420|nr:glycosyltransferase family 4 protein [Polynucleobacter corsicus]
MKLCLVCLASTQSGWTDHFATICSGLAERGHQLRVYVSQATMRSMELAAIGNIQIVEYDKNRFINSLKEIFKLIIKINSSDDQILCVYGEGPQHALVCLFSRIPLVSHIADPISHLGVKWRERVVFHITKVLMIISAKKVFFASSEVVESAIKAFPLLNFFGGLRSKFDIVKFANLIQFEPAAELIQSRANGIKNWDFIYFGRMEVYKGLPIFFESINILLNDGYSPRILLISKDLEGSKVPYICQQISSYLSHEELGSYLAQSICAVFPYLDANGSHTVQISNSFGAPVIASCVGSFASYVQDGVNGVLVEPGNPSDLAEALKNVIDNNNYFLRDFALKKWAEDFFSNKKSTLQLENIFQKVLD